MDGYAPLANFWASRGFVVIQPTFLDSTTLHPNPPATHEEAVQAFLNDPRKLVMWRYRIADMKRILDRFDFIEDSVPGLKGRLDRSHIAAAGHSFGAQTVAQLLGARVIDPDGSLDKDFFDSRIKAGILLSAGGRGGEALSPFALEHFPALNQSYAEMKTPALLVAGDNDHSPLTLNGPEWFTDAYTLSPGVDWLLTLFGGEHMLGGISGHQVTETTDENPERVAAVQRLTCAYLQSALSSGDNAWAAARSAFIENPDSVGRVIGKSPLNS